MARVPKPSVLEIPLTLHRQLTNLESVDDTLCPLFNEIPFPFHHFADDLPASQSRGRQALERSLLRFSEEAYRQLEVGLARKSLVC